MRLQFALIVGLFSAVLGGAAWGQSSETMAPLAPSPTAPMKAVRPHGQFAKMDRDGDGKVTLQEFIAFHDALFDRIDTTHSGRITKADVDAFAARHEAEEAGRMMRGKGGQGGGGGEKMLTKLSDRLTDGTAITKQQWEAMTARRFNRMDAGRLGYLTPDTLHHARTGADAAPGQAD